MYFLMAALCFGLSQGVLFTGDARKDFPSFDPFGRAFEDPRREVNVAAPVQASGWDISNVFLSYDPSQDTAYFGSFLLFLLLFLKCSPLMIGLSFFV